MKGEPAYVSWDGDNADIALGHYSQAVEEFRSISRFNTDLSNLDTNVSGRPGLSKDDYYAFRPGERPPSKFPDVIIAADIAYQKVGLIRNIIDLMGDFACQGIRLTHPNKRIEKFYRNWFKKVKGKERSERFLNNLYRVANVVIRKQTAKISSKAKKSLLTKVRESAFADVDIKLKNKPTPKSGIIPWRYVFLDPSIIAVVGGALASFVGQPAYAIKLPRSLSRTIKSPKTSLERQLVNQLPKDIVAAAKTNSFYPLPSDKTLVYHYKKDDWQAWAFPMIYAILDDITVLEKLKLADMAALDGAISNIRIFKLGNMEHKIAPTRVAASKLAEILENNVGGGTMDLVWGPDIELMESKTSVHQFLGEEKYTPHLNSIYAGLGIPPTLTGTFGATGTTNNFISLKTLVARLQYGRDILNTFWDNEITEVQHAMGFKLPANVEFNLSNLGDEEAEKALWIQLYDRNLISDELIQHKFGADPEMEKIRLNRENRDRNDGKMIPKSSPYHDPQFGIALKKVALQSGVMAPSQVGLRKDAVTRDLKTFPPERGEKSALQLRQPPGGKPPSSSKKGQPQQGRPRNSKDTKKRDKKTFKPKIKANRAVIEIWATVAQKAIAKVLNPELLKIYDKKNMRSLTSEEMQDAENIKFGVLCHLEPLGIIDHNTIQQALGCGNIPNDISVLYQYWETSVQETINRKLTLDELKQVQACLYTSYFSDEEES